MNDLKRQIQQLEINNRFLLSRFDVVHDMLCPDHLGTWQQRVEATVKAAKKLRPPKPPSAKTAELQVNATRVLNFLNTQLQSSFGYSPTNLNLIKARLKEPDVTVEGVEKMILRQIKKWSGTEMEEYLRPSTLFRASKFCNYYAAKDQPVDHKPKSFGDLCYNE